MSQIKLTVMLLTIPYRTDYLHKLISELELQANGLPVELLYLGDNLKTDVGTKRNRLKAMAQGKYSVWIDDDDWIDPKYIEYILNATEKDADVITYNNIVTVNDGKTPHPLVEKVVFKLAHKERTQDLPNKTYYYLPAHTHTIRHSIAMMEDFKPGTFTGVDFLWSEAIQQYLKTEVHIDKQLYHHRCEITEEKKQLRDGKIKSINDYRN